MELKKNNKYNIDKNKSTFFLLGIVIALALCLIMFEWTTTDKKDNIFANIKEEVIEEEQIPITEEEEQPQEIPPEVNVLEIFEIVDNDVKIENEVIFFDDKTSADDIVQAYTFIPRVEEVEKEDDIFQIVEDMPSFKGGDVQKFSDWVRERTKYPSIAQENGIQGKVFIGFVVDADGSVSNVTILRSVDKSLDEEAIRVVKSSPKWAPGKQRGQPVRVRFSIVVNFRLQ